MCFVSLLHPQVRETPSVCVSCFLLEKPHTLARKYFAFFLLPNFAMELQSESVLLFMFYRHGFCYQACRQKQREDFLVFHSIMKMYHKVLRNENIRRRLWFVTLMKEQLTLCMPV
jgi:hypothetical protein